MVAQEKRPSVCILTAFNEAFSDIAAITVPRMRAFADVHRHEVRVLEFERHNRPGNWGKVPAIRQALSDHDLILWIDADALIVRLDTDVCSAGVDGASLAIAWHDSRSAGDVSHFNAGVMLIRGNDWARNFFAQVWEVGQLDHKWSDQATIHHLLGYDHVLGIGPEQSNHPNRAHISRLPLEWNSIPGVAMAADPVIHHYAGASPAVRRRLLQADISTLRFREHSPELRQAISQQLNFWRIDLEPWAAEAQTANSTWFRLKESEMDRGRRLDDINTLHTAIAELRTQLEQSETDRVRCLRDIIRRWLRVRRR